VSIGTAKLDLLLADGNVVAEAVALAPLQGKHVVVSGASGLIGGTLLASLAAARGRGIRFDVTLLLRSQPNGEVANLAELCGAQIIQADLSESRVSLSLPADVLIHAAGASAPLDFMKRPLETLAIGGCATLQLLRAVVPGGRFLFVSSTEVYSGLEGRAATEADIGTTTPLHPRASYIEAKRAGETACIGARVEGINAVAARVGMTYGPGTRAGDTRVINRLIEQALCSGRVELLDRGDAVRSLCYVTDTIELLWNAVLHGQEAIYNVTGPCEMTIRELGRTICSLTDAELVMPQSAKSVPGAPGTVRVDVSRVTQEFGKTNWVSIEDGLGRTLDWQRLLYRKRRGGERGVQERRRQREP
jgi:UDP-glucuronate decarboxylase